MNKKIFYLVYGVPGSGKSTYVERCVKTTYPDLQHYEADMFFYNKLGKYEFNPRKLGMAHSWCQNMTRLAMKKGLPVCVSNTSLTPEERRPYFELANKYGYKIHVHRCYGEYENVHGVPKEKVVQMRKKLRSVSNEEIEMYNIERIEI